MSDETTPTETGAETPAMPSEPVTAIEAAAARMGVTIAEPRVFEINGEPVDEATYRAAEAQREGGPRAAYRIQMGDAPADAAREINAMLSRPDPAPGIQYSDAEARVARALLDVERDDAPAVPTWHDLEINGRRVMLAQARAFLASGGREARFARALLGL